MRLPRSHYLPNDMRKVFQHMVNYDIFYQTMFGR
jgi:hypothetical protein